MGIQQTILVIDDERNFARILEAKLRRSGFEVTMAPDAESGLVSLLRRSYSLVLLDIHLPDADGIAALPRLRAAAPSTPFLLMTAYEEEKLRARAVLAGAVDVLYKPFDLDELIQHIRWHIASSIRRRSQEATALVSAVRTGQNVVLTIGTGADRGDVDARVTVADENQFAVLTGRFIRPDTAGTVQVRYTGRDGMYRFRSRILGLQEHTGALALSKPAVIHRVQRRRYKRCLLNAPVSITADNATPTQRGAASSASDVDAIAHDISLGGMALASDVPLTPGSTVRLTLALPVAGATPLRTRARVLRCDEASEGLASGVYRIAVRFVRLASAARGMVDDYIATV